MRSKVGVFLDSCPTKGRQVRGNDNEGKDLSGWYVSAFGGKPDRSKSLPGSQYVREAYAGSQTSIAK